MDLCPEMLTFDPMRVVTSNTSVIHGSNTRKKNLPCSNTDFETMELSNLDQAYGSSSYRSIALFYYVPEKSKGHEDIVNLLRTALEELLSYVPAAVGRICFNEQEGRTEIRYKYFSAGNDMELEGMISSATNWGVQFMAASAEIDLAQLGDISDARRSLDLLYPSFTSTQKSNEQYLPIVAMQVTTFTCGSFTLAMKTHHAFADGYGASLFLRNLCSLARGDGLAVPLESRSRREVLQPRNPPSPIAGAHPYLTTAQDLEKRNKQLNGAIAAGPAFTTRFTFKICSVEALRHKASVGQAKRCSRYQALSALLWTARARSLLKVPAESGGQQKDEEFRLLFRVPCNMRGKAPSVLPGYMGNTILFCPVNASLQELCESPLSHIAHKIKVAMDTNATAEALQSQVDYIEMQLQAGMVPRPAGKSWFSVSSLVGLPFNDTDCGFGRPRYCASPSQQSSYVAILLDDPAAEAWNVLVVFHSQQERAFFRQELVDYVDHGHPSCSAEN